MNILSTNFLQKIALVVMLLIASVSIAPAQELSPSHLALARKYVELTDRSRIYEVALIETGIATMRTIISQNPDLTEQVSDVIGQVIAQYSDNKNELFDQFARVYALRLTEQELAEVVAFYETDAGQKLATQNAEANQDLQNVMRIFRSNLNSEFFARVRGVLRDQGLEL